MLYILVFIGIILLSFAIFGVDRASESMNHEPIINQKSLGNLFDLNKVKYLKTVIAFALGIVLTIIAYKNTHLEIGKDEYWRYLLPIISFLYAVYTFIIEINENDI